MDQGNLDVSTLQHYLKGTNFPAEKEEVATNAESNGAPPELGKPDQERGHRTHRQPREGYASGPEWPRPRVNKG